MTPTQQAESSLKRLEVWVYHQTGRVFIIDKSLGHDNNLLNAVAEIHLPDEASYKPDPTLNVQQRKDKLIARKEPIAQAMVRAFQITSAYDEGDLEHG